MRLLIYLYLYCCICLTATLSCSEGRLQNTAALSNIVQHYREAGQEDFDPRLDSLQVYAKGHETDAIEAVRKTLKAIQLTQRKDKATRITDSLLIEADSLAILTNHKGIEAWVKTQIGFYHYHYYCNLENALPYFFRSAQLLSDTSYSYFLDPADCLLKNAYYFGNIKDHEKSITLLKTALQQPDVSNSTLASIYYTLGATYSEQGEYSQASASFAETRKLAEGHDPVRYAKALGEQAVIAMKQGDLHEAKQLLLQDIAISKQHHEKRNTMYAQIRLGEVYIQLHQWDAAQQLLDQAHAHATSKRNLLSFEHEINILKLQIAQQLGDEHTQLQILARLRTMESELTEMDGKEAATRVNLELKKKDLEKELRDREADLSKEQEKQLIFLTLSVLLTVSLFFLRKKYKSTLEMQHTAFNGMLMHIETELAASEKKYGEACQSLSSYKTFLDDRNNQIDRLKAEIAQLQTYPVSDSKQQEQQLHTLLTSHLMTDENWTKFKSAFRAEQSAFYYHVQSSLPHLTESQLRIVLLKKIGLNNKEIANVVGVSPDSVKKASQRLRQKYGESFDKLY